MSEVIKLKTLSSQIRAQLRRDGKRFWANDNVSDYIGKGIGLN